MARKPPATGTLEISPKAAALLLDGLGKLAWVTAEVQTIAPVLRDLERIAAAKDPAAAAAPAPSSPDAPAQ